MSTWKVHKVHVLTWGTPTRVKFRLLRSLGKTTDIVLPLVLSYAKLIPAPRQRQKCAQETLT